MILTFLKNQHGKWLNICLQKAICKVDNRGMYPHVPGSKLLVLGMVIQPGIGTPHNGYINPYYWVDCSHPLLYGNNGGLDPIAHILSDQ